MIELSAPITIRSARLDDGPALTRLAALDSADVPRAPLLVAEVGGELKVAVSARDGATIADPFSPTADIVELLQARMRRSRARPRWTLALWPPRPRVARAPAQ